MPKVPKLILRNQPVGREATPWLEPQRERLAQLAKECSLVFKDTKLKGAAKIRALNHWMSQRLKGEDKWHSQEKR